MTDCHWVLTGHTAWTTEWYASAFDVTNRWLNHALSMSGRKRKEETACKCGSTTHKRTRSRHCHLNTRWVDEHLQLGDQVAANRELSRLESLRQALTGTGDAVSAVVPPASSPPASSPPAIVALLADEVHLLHSLRLPATGVTIFDAGGRRWHRQGCWYTRGRHGGTEHARGDEDCSDDGSSTAQ